MQRRCTDVCVLGGGPAGSAIAKLLSDLGYRVLVIEKHPFPRPHVGICLADATSSLLSHIGVHPSVFGDGSMRRVDTLVKWEASESSVSRQPGIHVDRGRFDQLLLRNAARSGAETLQPACVKALRVADDDGWRIDVSTSNEHMRIYARFVVDALGRSSRLISRRVRYAPPLFAMHSTWDLLERPDYDGFIEAGENAWLWIATLNDRRAMVSAYTDPKLASNCGRYRLDDLYQSQISRFSCLGRLKLDRMIAEVKGCDASGRYTENPVGQNFICVGDARLSVDPMASQGVHLALSSGIQAAAVVNTLLRDSSNSEAALAFYRDRQLEQMEMFSIQTATEYAKGAIRFASQFWHERARGAQSMLESVFGQPEPLANDQELVVCPLARLLPTPILGNDLVGIEQALHHPALKRPVAFLDGHRVVPLLRAIAHTTTPKRLLGVWQNRVPRCTGRQILEWLWAKGVIVSASNGAPT